MRVNGYLDFGFEVDLARLGAWDGLGFHADFHWWQGSRPTQRLIGGLIAMALSDWEAAATLRVFNLYLRQAFDGDRFVVKAGQIAADTDFMISRYGGVFLNAAFGDLPSQNLNLDAPVYPLAAPGVFMSARPLDWLTGRFGAATGDAGDGVAGNHGFDGASVATRATRSSSSPRAHRPEVSRRRTRSAASTTPAAPRFGTGVRRTAHTSST